MKIEKISPYYNIQKRNNKVTFGAASDITLEYVLKNHSKYLPERMINKIKEQILKNDTNIPLYELHDKVYKKLFEAGTLEEAKKLYPEFNDIKDIVALQNNRSIAIKTIKKLMPLDVFTLDYLKKLYKPSSQDSLVKEYGFTNRNLLIWLNEKLNIQKLNGNYIQLIKMSNEEENSRIAELSRKAIYADAQAQKYRLEKAAVAHRTPEYRAKKRQEMKDYYERNPEAAKKTGIISKLTWDKCPEIKDAFSKYTKLLSPYVKRILSKKQNGTKLTEEEKRIATGYYKGFWEQYHHLKSIYRQRRLEVIEELKNFKL